MPDSCFLIAATIWLSVNFVFFMILCSLKLKIFSNFQLPNFGAAYILSGDTIKKTFTEDNKEDFYKILHLNQAYFEEGEYKTWYNIFNNNSKATTDYLIDQVSSANPVIGWSYANIIKRSPYNGL